MPQSARQLRKKPLQLASGALRARRLRRRVSVERPDKKPQEPACAGELQQKQQQPAPAKKRLRSLSQCKSKSHPHQSPRCRPHPKPASPSKLAALESLPQEFRSRIQNVAILVEDFPPNQSPPQPGEQRKLLLGIFHGVPATKKSIFDVPTGPAHIVLYQKNIEAVCSSEAEVPPTNPPNPPARNGTLFRHD